MRTLRQKLACLVASAAVWLSAAGPVDSHPVSAAAPQTAAARAPEPVPLPNREGSLKFLVIGDFGTGTPAQYELGAQMAKFLAGFPAKLAITVGDNLYGGERPQDFKRRFEEPYRAVLEAGVKVYASLGNHDSREQARYAQFNMGGKTYYSLKAPVQNVKLVAIESDYPTPKQIEWLRGELSSGEDWIIPYFHHPLYSSGKQHGSNRDLRDVLEPLFLKSNVTVVFTGHDHFYERTKPQQGITYFVVGSTGALRPGDIDRKSGLTEVGFESDLAFLAVEIDGDQMFFNAISRTGKVVDSGVIERRRPAP
jgi:hypothetical protein